LSVKAKDTDEILGINDRVQLAWAHHRLNQNKIEALMISGVTILDPHTTFVSQEVEIGQDTIIFPFSWLEGKTSIGKRCIIGPQVFIEDTTIRDKTRVFFSFVSGSIIDEGSQIGPFSHLRRDTRIGREVKIGNFVETKKSSVADQSKVCHLSYIGDAELGRHVNVGAGTITCNYDGVKKHKTSICDNVFVGSNTALVAPVTIGEGSVIGAGSTITNDVPAASLGIARSRQKNIEGWVLRRKKDS
jgi:bifunctional UDP-N-acetylglucosamine pyrophosphorylase/glucosamine-1-phosphate N-acetyltransferase